MGKNRRIKPEEREAIAAAFAAGGKSHRQLARQFKISPHTVSSAIRKAQSGHLEDAPRCGRPKKMTNDVAERVRLLAETDPDFSIRKLKNELEAEGGPSVSRGSIRRVLHEVGLLPAEPEKLQLKPGLDRTLKKLKEGLERFQNTQRFARSSMALIKDILPMMNNELDVTKIGELAQLLQVTGEKYEIGEGEVANTFKSASEVLQKLSEEEKTFREYVQLNCLDQLKLIEEDNKKLEETPETEKDLVTVTEEMFVAKRKLRNAKKNRDSYRASAQEFTKVYERRKEAIEHVMPHVNQHRNTQCEAIKQLLALQRIHYLRAASILEDYII